MIMRSPFRWKFAGILLVMGLALYVLIPSFLGLPQKKEVLESQKKPIPFAYHLFPSKGLNLGLDLQGGIYAEFEVELQEAVLSRLNLAIQELLREIKNKPAVPAEWHMEPATTHAVFSFGDASQQKLFLEEASKFRQLVNGKLVFVFQKKESSSFTQALLEATEDYAQNTQEEIMQQATQSVRNRIDRYGLAEPSVQRQGANRVIVELPGVQDPDRALKVIQQAGTLEFKLVHEKVPAAQTAEWVETARKEKNLGTGYSLEEVKSLNEVLKDKLPAGTEIAFELQRHPTTHAVTNAIPLLLESKAYITGEMLQNARVDYDRNEPFVSLDFNPTGSKNFADVTKAHVKERLAILLDGFIHSSPQIQEPILGGRARITLGYGNRAELQREAQDLTLVLQEGALPARLKEATKTVIGPTLGADSIQWSFRAMQIGALLVILFMLVYYRWSGLLANAAVFLNTLFIFALLAMFQATLTLPGMAGIILTIGMAVDANVLIFERMREELRGGLPPKEAVQLSYSNALRAIIDSNLTTVIAGLILYQFGTGPIRGFAVTLIIGLVCNIFTAVFMTRTVFDYFVVEKKITTVSV